MLTWLKCNDLHFPPLEAALAEPNGLLAAGGDLSPERLIAAYRHGCFPWYQEGQPLMWWSPDPRTVLGLDELHISRSLSKRIRSGSYQVSFDQSFSEVICECAGPRNYTNGTWITDAMQVAYQQLHEMGIAHSVEVWQEDRLVGGLYGLAMGQLFFGESMFSRANDASKVGFVALIEYLKARGFMLVDCQMHTQHLTSFGARSISRGQFKCVLNEYLGKPGESNWKLR
ncbi:leucyl/phenylalanyl-tRNA--protein transferase [Azomonas macrocytogenes]|uniref:leucyl/phenylalanyl-tRNA--protein transferase n=1 Tax=Azomonas macrocytogenes TaxID=69962 RepID=UPI001606A2C9|nr:leucyl/phenylalanyl-tRNA--protein transferase [Azomonas macrocytogenes]